MPTVHTAPLLLALEKGPLEWQVAVAPAPDPRWQTQSAGYAWDFELRPQEGRDLVELRAPARLVDAAHGAFTVTAETLQDGRVVDTWQPVGDQLGSAPLASGAQVYVRFHAAPLDPNLPLAVPASANARGGGHVHVKTGGGGGGPIGAGP